MNDNKKGSEKRILRSINDPVKRLIRLNHKPGKEIIGHDVESTEMRGRQLLTRLFLENVVSHSFSEVEFKLRRLSKETELVNKQIIRIKVSLLLHQNKDSNTLLLLLIDIKTEVVFLFGFIVTR